MRNLNKVLGIKYYVLSIPVRCALCTVVIVGLWSLIIDHSHAVSYYPQITFRYQHHLFYLDPDSFPSWRSTEEAWTYHGQDIAAPAVLRVDGDTLPSLPEGMVRSLRSVWDADAIAETIREEIANQFNRPRGEVTISRTASGVVFEGLGLLGREINLERTAALTVEAIENSVNDIVLPVRILQPQMAVLDSELQDLGIQEVIAIGESDFSFSPGPRRRNIANGLDKFNGHIIKQGETFSFNEILGPVNAATGFEKELVILGERTLPDFGGGLCQVSTTAYRGIWEYGFPIAKRRNHSYSVQYYAPQGTDATIYPPYTDIQFVNDSPGALLIQTHAEGDRAYFIYYGTHDDRQSEIIGPYTWNHRPPPADRLEYTTDIPAGTTRKVGKATPGVQAAWFRVVRKSGEIEETAESFYSYYEARPNFTQIGMAVSSLIPPESTGDVDPHSIAGRRLERRGSRSDE